MAIALATAVAVEGASAGAGATAVVNVASTADTVIIWGAEQSGTQIVEAKYAGSSTVPVRAMGSTLSDQSLSMWIITNPSTGAISVNTSGSAGSPKHIGAAVYTGVSTVTAYASTVVGKSSVSGTSGNVGITLASSALAVTTVYRIGAALSSGPTTWGAGITERASSYAGGVGRVVMADTPSATTLDWQYSTAGGWIQQALVLQSGSEPVAAASLFGFW